MQKSFSFKGITRSNDPLMAADGECMEMMNLRSCNGSFKPVPTPVSIASLPVRYLSVMWHGMAGYYICLTDDDRRTLHFYDKDWNRLAGDDGKELLFEELVGVTGVEVLGYVVCCLTDDGMRYLLFGEGRYHWLGESPAVPRLDISLESKLYTLTTEESFAGGSNIEDFESSWRCNKKGFIDECIYYLNIDGYYIDRALFRFALRLYDGSYIYCSHVIYASDDEMMDYVGRDSDNFYTEKATAGEYAPYTVRVKGFRPLFSFSSLNLEPWNDVVVGIDVFTTGSIMGHKAETLVARLHDSDTGGVIRKSFEGYSLKTVDELGDEVLSASLFYKIAEFDIHGNCTFNVKDVSPTNLQLQQSLVSSSLPASYSSVSGGCSCVLNNRLHVASLKETLFAGYDASMVAPVGRAKANIEGIAVETKIRTSSGVATVVRNYGSTDVCCGNGVFELTPLLSYPDSRAFEMTVYVYVDTELFCKNFVLLPHKYLDCAQYLHKGGNSFTVAVESVFRSGFVAADVNDDDVLKLFSYELGVHEVVYSEADGCWKYEGRDYPPAEFGHLRIFAIPRDVTDGDRIVFTIETEEGSEGKVDICNIPVDSTWTVLGGAMPESSRSSEERPNAIKVSATDNPFLFPAECTYAPSQAKVMAMASNNMELSQGRFGEHPLFVFCEDGIWAMSIDASGRVAYSGSYPFSREVCRNVRAVCCIDSGLVFVGQQGVMLVSGNRLKNISSALLPENNLSSFHQENDFFVRIASRVGLQKNIDVVDFHDYIGKCRIAYDARHGEIVVSNEQSDNCYVYSLSGAVWSRISCRVSGFVSGDVSLKMLVNSGNGTSVLVQGSEQVSSNNVLLVTRPQLFGSKQYKRIAQLVLRAYASPPVTNTAKAPVLACYMLCSNDGVHFRIVDGKECSGEAQDLRFPFFPTRAYRYFMFAVAGNMGVSSMITGLDADVSQAWNNRMG